VPEITQTRKTKHGTMTAEEMKRKWPLDEWTPPTTSSENEVPEKDLPEGKALRKQFKGLTAEEKMAYEQKHFVSHFRTTVLERRLTMRRISMDEFQKQHHRGKQAVLRPDPTPRTSLSLASMSSSTISRVILSLIEPAPWSLTTKT
jgi:hypothetical protein